MVSDGGSKDKDLSNVTLSKDEKKSLAQKAVKKEVSFIQVERAEWTQQPTAFDHLPPSEKPFPIEPFPNERQRLPFKMTDEDRKRRKIWVESQELTDREPIRVPELEKMIYNPIRRLYRLPTDRLFNSLAPMVGEHRVPFLRFCIPKIFLGYIGACLLYYQIKYNTQVKIRLAIIYFIWVLILVYYRHGRKEVKVLVS